MLAKKEVKIVRKFRTPTKEALALKKALEVRGVRVFVELNDGHKNIDLAIPKAKLNIEVDGIQHLTNPKQIVADLSRGYYSHKNGYDTMHIPNEMVNRHLEDIAQALSEASLMRQKMVHVHML